MFLHVNVITKALYVLQDKIVDCYMCPAYAHSYLSN